MIRPLVFNGNIIGRVLWPLVVKKFKPSRANAFSNFLHCHATSMFINSTNKIPSINTLKRTFYVIVFSLTISYYPQVIVPCEKMKPCVTVAMISDHLASFYGLEVTKAIPLNGYYDANFCVEVNLFF